MRTPRCRQSRAVSATQARATARYGHVETLFFGLSLGPIPVLAAISLAMSFGVMGVINMAHGELIILGAYCSWGMQQLLQSLGVALLLAIPAAILVTGLIGIAIGLNGAGIGYLPQGRLIFPLLNVEENLRIGLVARTDGARRVPDPVRAFFPVLAEMRHRCGGGLPGGQHQQLAIARALVTEPSLLILDEPTEGIQPIIVAGIGEIISRLNRELGLTVLPVEQKLACARRVGNRFEIMDRGSIVARGDIDKLNDQLVHDYLTV